MASQAQQAQQAQCYLPSPSCTYSFHGRINYTAQPQMPEVPLPGPEPSALWASLSFFSFGPLLLLGLQGGLGSRLSEWGGCGGLSASTSASPTEWAPSSHSEQNFSLAPRSV